MLTPEHRIGQQRYESNIILVPRARRFLVTWSGNEGLWNSGSSRYRMLSRVALGTRMRATYVPGYIERSAPTITFLAVSLWNNKRIKERLTPRF